MRFAKPVYFQKHTAGTYNEETGNYDGATVEETKLYASVTCSGAETMNLIYGEIRQESLTIRLLTHYDEPFDRIRVDDKVYRVDMQRRLRDKHVFVVSEVQ